MLRRDYSTYVRDVSNERSMARVCKIESPSVGTSISTAAERLAVCPRELSRLLHGVVKIPLPV